MTREEQIKQVAEEWAKDSYCDKHNLIWFFKKGTEWADEHPINYDGKAMLHVLNKGAAIGRREMLDKACEWLFEYNKRQAKRFSAKSMMRLPDYTINVGDFRKAMEEQR